MTQFVPDSKHLLKRRMSSGWDAHHVCKTLVLWYPELLRVGSIHVDMRQPRQVMEFLQCLQDYPADLQDIMILLAQRYGVQKATFALDNAIRRHVEETRRRHDEEVAEGDASVEPERLTA
ncbi:MAG: hypothetical protein HKN59_04255 [Gammaproteobacteria bacterium]|nr:hypothetical protein [Gammaproteobacteria bacterium]